MAWGQPAETPSQEPVSIPNAQQPEEQLSALDQVQGGEQAVEIHEKVEETDEQRKRRQNDEVNTWIDAKTALAKFKTEEGEARAVVSSSFFPTPKKGTQYAPLGGGWRLKLVFGWNYKLGETKKIDELSGLEVTVETQIKDLEERIKALGPEGEMIVRRVIRWSPELVEKEYLLLASEIATPAETAAFDLITEMLTITPASPKLEMVEPPKPKS